MKKLFVTLCGIAVLSSLSGHAFAENTGYGGDFSAGEHKLTPEMKAKMEQKKAEFQQRLNLTTEQKEKMEALHQSAREKMRPLFESMKIEIKKMKQLGAASASEQDKKAQMAKIQSIRNQTKTIRESNFNQIQTILTPEQQKEFNKMHEERKNLRKEKMNQFKEKRNNMKNNTDNFEEE